ncbi:diacylglycerol kinase eta-like [Coturnix japonica]|uniref:diacylglycerol kinase eta-like n=1 Tax=Coturnix japonica TaxID=93934 RepID=UPI0013A5D834|nr:diacylglycerol kinase eta-like [Coturnix japonica]
MEEHGEPSYSGRSPAWEELESGKMAGAEAGMSGAGIQQQPQQQPQHPAADESSDSEGEQEGPHKLIRKVSTSGQMRSKVRDEEGTGARRLLPAPAPDGVARGRIPLPPD